MISMKIFHKRDDTNENLLGRAMEIVKICGKSNKQRNAHTYNNDLSKSF